MNGRDDSINILDNVIHNITGVSADGNHRLRHRPHRGNH